MFLISSTSKKDKIEAYRRNLAKKIQYLRMKEGGEPILKLIELIMTAIDYDSKSETIRGMIKEIGINCGAGYSSSLELFEAALNYAEFSLRQKKTMTVHEWRDAIYTIAVSIESHKSKISKMEQIMDSDTAITKEMASKVDWRELTNNYNLDRIKEVVNKYGKSNDEKRIVVKAIFDTLMSTDKLYNIPYTVDKLIHQLYQKYGGERQDLSPVIVEKKPKQGKPEVPEELITSGLWKKLKESGLVNENEQPTISRTETAILAEILLEKMGKDHQWSIFEKIWNRKNMRIDFQDAVHLNKYSDFRKQVLKILG